jgi:phenylacetate-coenzyme A ligase PaaK-like adenylate-forming protein
MKPKTKKILRRYLRSAPSIVRLGLSFYYWYLITVLVIGLSRYIPFFKIFRIEIDEDTEVTTKSNLRSLTESLRKSLRTTHRIITTGGSTGHPTELIVSNNYEQIFTATRFAAWRQFGFRPSMRQLTLSYTFDNNRHLQFGYRRKSLDVNLQKISEVASDRRLIHHLNSWSPEVVIGFPSSVHELCVSLNRHSQVIQGVKLVILGSENLLDYQLESIKKTFKCPVFSWYGMAEMAVFAYQCPHRQGFHFLPHIGVIGEPKADDGHFEIVATKTLSDVLPINRYATEDIATGYSLKSCSCGVRLQTVSQIVGRESSYLETSEGNRITISMLNSHHHNLNVVLHYQFVQHSPGHVQVLFVTHDDSFNISMNQMREYLDFVLPPTLEYVLSRVPEISRTPRGKIKLIVRN